jgi:hypothetical protein
MQLPVKRPRLNARAAQAIFALSIFVFFASWLGGDRFAVAAASQDTPGAANSQDIGGVWIGQLSEKMADGRVGHGSLYVRLRQKGADISGVAGDSAASASPIENAVLSGKHLKFSVTTPGSPQGGVQLKVELDANGDAMEGKGHALRNSDNHTWDVEIKLARNK